MANHKSESIVKWKHEVAKWSSSGLSQHEYCRQMNIPHSTFHGWYSKLKKIEVEALPAISKDFIKMKFNDEQLSSDKSLMVGSSGINVSIGRGISISLRKGFEVIELQRTVKALLEVL